MGGEQNSKGLLRFGVFTQPGPKAVNMRLSCRTVRCRRFATALVPTRSGNEISRRDCALSSGNFPPGQASPTWRWIVVLEGARRTPFGKPFVAAPGVNTKLVNRSAPDLFPACIMPKKSFIRRETRSAAPLVWVRVICSNALKTPIFLCLTKCLLNRI